VHVRSKPGKGSVFSIDITLPLSSAAIQVKDRQPEIDETIVEAVQRTGAVLIIEDDPEVCKLLDLLLKDQGCHTATASDGIAALDLVARGKIRPDLILADYNLPKGLDGFQVVEKLRAQLHRRIIHAEAEFQASQTLVNAAQILGSIPAAMQLRYLQTLSEIGAEQNFTVVFPMPIDIVKPFLELLEKTGKPRGANGAALAPLTNELPLSA
jgi:CheY-like chemotaxis protein